MSSRPGWVVCVNTCVCCLGGLLTPCLSVKAWFIRLRIRANREGELERAWGWLFVYLPLFFHSLYFPQSDEENLAEKSSTVEGLHPNKSKCNNSKRLQCWSQKSIAVHQETYNRVLKTSHNWIKQPWLSKQALSLKPVWTVFTCLHCLVAPFSLDQHVRTEFTFTTSKG